MKTMGNHRVRYSAGKLLIVSLLLWWSPGGVAAQVAIGETTNPAPWAAVGTEYMVVADHPLASQAGARILAAGGNAADAAVAVSFALGVVRAYSTGLGGGGFLMIKKPGDKPKIVDFRERAPAACTPDKYLDHQGNRLPGKTVTGAWAAGVPGTLKGMTYVLKTYGTMSLVEVIQPAVELAERGFPVDEHTHQNMIGLASHLKKYPEYQSAYAELAETFLKDGEAYAKGDTLRRPRLAATLRLIATEGADILYSPSGKLHQALSEVMAAVDGPIQSSDLTNYAIALREPLAGNFRGYQTWTMPPPSSGGAVISEVLNAIERFEVTGVDLAKRPERQAHLIVEAFKHSFADRAQGLGDWDFDPDGVIHTTIKRMIDPSTAKKIIADLNPTSTYPSEHYGSGKLADDGGTSHYCVMDREGTAVVCTETINLPFGSYLMIPGTGIVLNNELDDFSILANVANAFGLIQADENLIGPGKRPLSSMSPTIFTLDDQPALLVGGSGGPRIITGSLHVILNILEYGMSPDDAVAAPRFHHQWSPDVVNVEEELDCVILNRLISGGHRISKYRSHPGHIQVLTYRDGILFGAADPRKGGRPAGR